MEREGQTTAANPLTQPRAAVRTRYEAAERGRSGAWRHPPKGGGTRHHPPHVTSVSYRDRTHRHLHNGPSPTREFARVGRAQCGQLYGV